MLLISSCSTPPKTELPEPVRQLENVVVISGEPDTLELHARRTYGSTDSVLIGRVGAVQVDRQNRVYIMDRNQKFIFVFNPDGSLAARMGGEGRGPGEFTFPGVTASVHGRTLYFDDGFRRIVNAFDLETMEYSHTIRLRPENKADYDSLGNYNASVHRVVNDSTLLMGFQEAGVRSTVESPAHRSFYLMDHDGRIISNELFKLPDHLFYTTMMNGNEQFATFPFTPASHVEVSDNGTIFTAEGSLFLIKEYGPDGTYRRAFYYPYEKAPLERDRLLEEYEVDFHKKIIRTSDLPDTWPVLRDLIPDSENRLWISVFGEDGDTSEWWIVNSSGELLGIFHEPDDEHIRVVRNGYIYTTKTLESGETVLQQYQVL